MAINNYEPINNQPTIQPRTVTGIFTKYIAKTLPLAFDESMSYYECLCALLEYLNETIVPDINNVNEGLEEIQNLYTELQTYINNAMEEFENSVDNKVQNLEDFMNNYFDNLDVQEEINNKLDAMVEAGTLQEIIADYLNSKAVFGFDNVASMKSSTNLIDGSYAETLGYYSKNDGGKALYKIRTITNDDIVDNATIIEIGDSSNQLIAELIKDFPVNAKQIGCKTDGTDNSTIINNYLANHNTTGLYFPDGIYTVNNEIDTIGNVTMSNNAWLKAGTALDCIVHINKNLTIPTGSFANNYPKNLVFKINVDGDKKALTGIRTDKLHWAKLVLTAKNCEVYGVYTRYDNTKGHAENTFDIQTMYDTENGTNTSTGVYVGGSDDIYNNITSINTKYGVEIHGGDNSFGTIHCWLVNSDLWNGSKMILISNQKNHINNLIVDTYETGIAFNSMFNVSTGVFNYFIDFMYGLINTSFIPETLRTSYKIWDFTGLTGTAKNNSSLIINGYIGNDQNTAKISLGGDGICPFNTKLVYADDYTSPKWTYNLDYCPEGNFGFLGDADVEGKPTYVTGGNFVLKTSNSSYGKEQELIQVGLNRTTGATTYNTDTLQPTGNFTFFYKRVVSKFNVGNNPWGQYASYYVQEPTSE